MFVESTDFIELRGTRLTSVTRRIRPRPDREVGPSASRTSVSLERSVPLSVVEKQEPPPPTQTRRRGTVGSRGGRARSWFPSRGSPITHSSGPTDPDSSTLNVRLSVLVEKKDLPPGPRQNVV